jgi:hypothetical protein
MKRKKKYEIQVEWLHSWADEEDYEKNISVALKKTCQQVADIAQVAADQMLQLNIKSLSFLPPRFPRNWGQERGQILVKFTTKSHKKTS